MNKIEKIIYDIYPLNRYNVSDEIDQTLLRLKRDYPEVKIDSYKTGLKVWDWEIPQKWKLSNATLSAGDNVLFSHLDHPLRVWSGSWATSKTLSYDELLPHLFFSEDNPDVLPWRYKYYYNDHNFFGFSLTRKEFEQLDKNAIYKIDIDTTFYNDALSVGYIILKGQTDQSIVISSDICHPAQANDSLSGVAAALYVYEKLKLSNNYFTYIFTFQTEMIGTMAFLSQNPKLKNSMQYGVFSEMLGHEGKLVLQHSLSKNTRIDQVALDVLLDHHANNFEVKDYLDRCIVNDELIYNHVGVNIPMISINRGTFDHYHTSGDNFKRLNFDLINEAADIIYEVVSRIDNKKYTITQAERCPPRKTFANRYEKNLASEDYLPIPLFIGPLFLSKHDLYVDWQIDPELNRSIEKLMISINGINTCYDIADRCGLQFDKVYNYLIQFEKRNLIKIQKLF